MVDIALLPELTVFPENAVTRVVPREVAYSGSSAIGYELVRLPNPERAIVDIAKLKDYCLDTEHEDGKHKARVFAAVLGVRLGDADWLQERLREAAFGEATQSFTNEFGSLYVVDFRMSTSHGEAAVRSHWIVRVGEDFPRLTTCFVLKNSERRK